MSISVAPFGKTAVLVRLDAAPGLATSAALAHITAELRATRGVVEAWSGLTEAAATTGSEGERDRLLARLRDRDFGYDRDTEDAFAGYRSLSLPTVYDGPDLATVAGAVGLNPQRLADRHAALVFRVLAVGFRPGFAYLQPARPGDAPWIGLPRREEPRARVPAGTLAAAASMCAVYPAVSPGGWHLIGRVVDWERLLGQTAGAPFAVGDAVTFPAAP